MDFHSMKRKELQALCKKHRIPANLSNLEMANKLEEFFKENGRSLTQGLIKEQDENASETDGADVVTNRRVKKVRFSPDHELIEFTRSRQMKRSRRISVSSRNASSSVENVDSSGVNNEGVGRPGRVTRSRGSKLMEGEVIEKKKGRKSVNQKNNRGAIENFNNGDSREGDVYSLSGEMQDRGELLVEGVQNPRKGGRKKASNDDRREKKVVDNANDEKLIEEIVNIPGRVTRSRGQKLMEASTRKENRGRKVAKNTMVRAETDENRVSTESSSRRRGKVVEEKLAMGLGLRVKNNGKGCEEVMDNMESAGLHVMVEPQILLRRSQRNANKVGDSVILNDGTMKQENGGVKGLRKTPKLLAAEGSGVDEESAGSKVDRDGRPVLQIEEPVKLDLRRSSRRKTVIASHEIGNCLPKAETENGFPLRNSVLQLGIAGGVSKDNKKAHQPAGITRRSVQKSSSLKPVSSDEKFDTDTAVNMSEADMHLSKPCLVEKGSPTVQKNMRRSRRNASKDKSKEILDEFGGDSIIQQKNDARKRRRGPISGGDVIKTEEDPISLKRSMRRESRSEEAEPAAAISRVDDETNPPSRWKEPHVDAQLSMTEVAESTITKNIVSLGLSGETHTEKQDVSLADSAGSADIKLINGNELENSDEDAALNIAKLKTDSGKQISSCKLRDIEKVDSCLDSDVQKLIDENISDTDKKDPEVQMSSQTQDSSGNNTIVDQALLEVSNVCANAGFAESTSSADSILLGDQKDFKTDLEVIEAEADTHIEPCLDVVDHVAKNMDSAATEHANFISSSAACHHNDVESEAAADKHIEPSLDVVDHVGRVEGVLVHENVDFAATEHANFISSSTVCHHNDVESVAEAEKHIEPSLDVVDHVARVEGVPVQENVDSAETEHDNFVSSSTACHQTDVESEAEADKYIEPSLDVVNHVPKVEGDPVQENMDSAATEHANFISSSAACNHNDVESEAEADKRIEPSLDVVDHVARVEGVLVHENVDSAATEHANFISSSTVCHHNDVESAAEVDKHIEPSLDVVDHVASVEGVPVQENMDAAATEHDNFVSSSTASHHSDVESEAEADKYIEPSVDVVNHVPKVEGVPVQENMDSAATEHANLVSSSTACHHDDVDHLETSNIFENNNEDTPPKAGEHSALESCESALRLKELSSDKLGRSIEGDNTAEGDDTYFHKGIDSELAETDKGGCLHDHKSASNENSESTVPDVSDGERSASIIPQDGGNFSVMNSDEQGMDKDSPVLTPITICLNSDEVNLNRCFKADHIEREETCIYKSIPSESARTDEGGSSMGHKSKCREDGEFSVSNLFDAERSIMITPQDREIFSGEDSIKQRRFNEDQIDEGDETLVYKNNQSELAEVDEGSCLKDHKSTKVEDQEFAVSYLFVAEKSMRSMSQDRGIFSAGYSVKDSNEQLMVHDFSAVATMSANYNKVKFNAGSSSLLEIYPHEPNSASDNRGTVPTTSKMCEDIDKETGAADIIQENEVATFEVNTPGDEISMEKTTEDGEPETFNQADEQTRKDTHELVEQPNSPLAKATADTIQGHEASNSESVTAGHAMSISNPNGKGKTSEVEISNTKENANDANCGKDKEDIADACISDGAISVDASNGVKSLPQLNFQDTEETKYQCNSPVVGHTVSEGCEEPTSVESSKSWTEIELNNLFGTTVDHITPARLKYTSSEIVNLTMSMNRLIANSGEMEGERGNECATIQYENVALPTDEENQLKWLFESPIKIVNSCKVDATSGHDTELNRAVISVIECVDTMKQIESDVEVGDAGREVDKGFYLGNSSSENGEDVTNEELKEFDSVELANTCVTMVLSEAEDDVCEPSEEQFTETTCNCKKETNSPTEENQEEKIISLGDSCLYEEATENYSASTEKNIINSSGSPRNSDKDENCTDMLIDTDLSENVSCGSRAYGISEGTITPSSESAGGLSDADHQKSNVPGDSHCVNSCNEDGNILGETLVENLKGPLAAEIENCGSFDGSSPSIFSRASHAETKDAKSIREDADPCEAKIWDEKAGNPRSSHDTSDELHTNSEMANFESLSVGHNLCQEADKLTTTLELQSTSKETKETGTTIQNIDNMVPAAEHGPSVYSAEYDILSSLVMHVIQGDTENGDDEHSEVDSPVLDLEDDDEKNGKEVQETSYATVVPSCNEGPHFEEKIVDFNNNIQTSSDVPDSGYSEILKESDVADTIKEYIDSESSLSLHFNGSSASHVLTHTNERNSCENAALGELDQEENAALGESDQDDIGVLANSEGGGDKPSVEALEAESKEQEEATLSMELAPGSKKLVISPARINLLVEEGSSSKKPSVETKGFAVNDTLETNHRSSSKQSCSTAKNKARTILIHGTPRKLMTMADMKENAATHKRSNNIGDFTTARPAKRRALQDVHWK
ncbi:hypothetical protein Salat_1251400 [Sesamum alatum]|uniref:Uncharacterized protein n=1 Tax=Sesamum alatum TaxID=300844 RepID=A0AAE1YH54_9LAMI|nr:hypothetical protein Salat_1251400 [Sesamum alatum]